MFPDVPLNAIVALFFSTLLGVGAAVLADVLDNTVRDPEQIQRRFKTDVVGALPVVKHWRGRAGDGGHQRHRQGASENREAARTIGRRLRRRCGLCAIPFCFPTWRAVRVA